MIPEHLVQEVEQLLAQKKLTYRQIAQRTGVSRGSVSAIARGTRRPRGEANEHLVPETSGYYHARCTGCGHHVVMPCLICAVRQHKERTANAKPKLR